MGPDDFAFPIPELNWSNGMSLRDYFAAKAMQGIVARGEETVEYIANRAYCIADAMLRARKD